MVGSAGSKYAACQTYQTDDRHEGELKGHRGPRAGSRTDPDHRCQFAVRTTTQTPSHNDARSASG